MVLFASAGSRVFAGLSGVAAVAAGGVLIGAPLLLKAPQDPHNTLRSTGAASYFDVITGRRLQGTFVQETTTSGHPRARSARVGSYDQVSVSTFVTAEGKRRQLASSSLTQAFDRRTGAGRPGQYGDTLGTTAHLVKLPFDTQKRTYLIWDVTAKRAIPLRYVGEHTDTGLPVLAFSRDVVPTDLGVLALLPAVPGSFLGHREIRTVPVHEWYEATQTRLDVEPVTGRLVGGRSSPHLWLQATSGPLAGQRIDLLTVTDASPDAASTARLLAEAKHARVQVLRLRRAPWALGACAVVLLAVALLVPPRRRASSAFPQGIPAPRPEADDIPGHPVTSPAAARQRPRNVRDVLQK